MKRLLALGLTVSMMTAAAGATAAGKTAAKTAKAEKCAGCAKAQKLAQELKALSYAKDADRLKGNEKAVAAATELEKFQKLPKKDANRLKLFGDLLVLSREAGPFDGESQVSQVLSDVVQSDAELKKAYDSYIQSVKAGPKAEQCKTAQLDKTVSSIICLDKAGVKGQDLATATDPAKAKTCSLSFNYESCLKDGAGL